MTRDRGREHTVTYIPGMSGFMTRPTTTKQGDLVGPDGSEVPGKDDLFLFVEGEVRVGEDETVERVLDESLWVGDKVFSVNGCHGDECVVEENAGTKKD